MLKSIKEGVFVMCGGTRDQFTGVVGKYVGAVKRYLGPTFSIPYFSVSIVNGQRVGLRHILQDGDTLEFIGAYGVKGGGDESPEVAAARALVQFDPQLREILATVNSKHLDVDSSVYLALSLARQHFTETYGPINGRALELLDGIATDIRRVADTLSPTPPQKVGSDYIAQKLGCSKAWITELARDNRLPRCCVVQGTGNGKPWRFHRREVDHWIEGGATILDQAD